MSFDLAKLDTAKVAEEGAELHVAHPTTGEDLGITITLIGTDSKTFRDISKSRATASLKKKTREIDLDQNLFNNYIPWSVSIGIDIKTKEDALRFCQRRKRPLHIHRYLFDGHITYQNPQGL